MARLRIKNAKYFTWDKRSLKGGVYHKEYHKNYRDFKTVEEARGFARGKKYVQISDMNGNSVRKTTRPINRRQSSGFGFNFGLSNKSIWSR